jgi:predicted component of type VI protein secretion system
MAGTTFNQLSLEVESVLQDLSNILNGIAQQSSSQQVVETASSLSQFCAGTIDINHLQNNFANIWL